MKKLFLLVLLLLPINALAQDAKKPEPPKQDVVFSTTESDELNKLLGKLKGLGPQIQKADEELKESPFYLKLKSLSRQVQKATEEMKDSAPYLKWESLTTQRESASSRIQEIIARACGEAGIKPSECEVAPDGKGLRRKQSVQAPPETSKPE